MERSRRTALGLLGVATAVTTAGLILTGTGLTAVADRTAGTVLVGLGPEERGLRVTTRSAADPDAQADAARTVLASAVPGMDVLDTRLTFPVGSEAGDVVLAHTETWPDRVRLEGTAPAARTDGVIEVAAPAAADLAVGELTVGQAGVPVLVTARWEPLDPADPVWFGDPGLTTGTMTDQRGAVGPLWTAGPDDVAAAVDLPQQRWTLVPPADLTAAGAARTADRLEAVPAALADAGLLVRGQVVDGTGPEHLAALVAGLRTARALAAVPFALVAVAGLVTALAVARVLAVVTHRERELLLARGATPRWLIRRDLATLLAVAGAGAVAGLGAGVLAARAIAPGGPGAPEWPGGLGVLGAPPLLVTVVAVALVLASGGRLPVDRGRGRLPLVLATAVGVATAVSAAQLLRLGPVTAGSPEPLAAPAPALLLALAGVVAARLARGGRAAAGLAARTPGLQPLLTVRRLGLPATDGAALALAGGAAVLAAVAGSGPLARPFVAASGVAAVGALLLAGVVLTAGALGRRRAVAVDRDLLGHLGAERPGRRARRTALGVGWVLAAAAGAVVAALLASPVGGVA